MNKIKSRMFVLAGLLLATLLISGCQGILVTRNGESGTGERVTRPFNFTGFKQVDIGSAFTYEISRADTYSIRITADDNLFDRIQVVQEGDKIVIGLKGLTMFGSDRMTAEITMPQLREADLSGAANGTISGFSSADRLDVDASGASVVELVGISAGDFRGDLSGASKVSGHLTAADVQFELSGASNLQLEGSAGNLVLDASGASLANLTDFTVNNADVRLSGASNGTVNLGGRLDADLSGASSLAYIGEPTMGDIDITEASNLKKR